VYYKQRVDLCLVIYLYVSETGKDVTQTPTSWWGWRNDVCDDIRAVAMHTVDACGSEKYCAPSVCGDYKGMGVLLKTRGGMGKI